MDKSAVPTEIIRFALFCPPVRQWVQRGVLNFCILKSLALQSISRIFFKKMQSSIPEISLYRVNPCLNIPIWTSLFYPSPPSQSSLRIYLSKVSLMHLLKRGSSNRDFALYKKIQKANSPTFKIFSLKSLARERISALKSSGTYFWTPKKRGLSAPSFSCWPLPAPLLYP